MVQAAELFLRTAESITGIDDVAVVAYRRTSRHHAEVVLRSPDGVDHLARVRSRPVAPAMLTCRAEQPGEAMAYDLLSLTGLR